MIDSAMKLFENIKLNNGKLFAKGSILYNWQAVYRGC